jgi:hypothetical protein
LPDPTVDVGPVAGGKLPPPDPCVSVGDPEPPLEPLEDDGAGGGGAEVTGVDGAVVAGGV